MKSIEINLRESYDVMIGHGLLQRTGEILSTRFAGSRIALITDSIVDKLYGTTVEASLASAGFLVEKYAFPAGEHSKTMTTLTEILAFLAQKELTRRDLIIALGGGVTGDMAGFAAAVYLRGITCIQMPTTLLAAIDSSIGGKTAVNLPSGKNLAGAFHQPSLVLCDPDTLKTLPASVLADGMSEAIKTGVIADRPLFDLFNNPPTSAMFEDIIARCVAIKRDFVLADERDTGLRQILNFGHTFGHAIEKLSGYTVSHGHAVAIGMVLMARGAWKMGLTKENVVPALCAVLKKNALPFKCPYDAEALFSVVLQDKKRGGDIITLVIPEKIGKASLLTVSLRDAKHLLACALEGRED